MHTASTVFSIFLSVMLEESFRDMGTESTCNHASMQTSLHLHTSERRPKTQIYLFFLVFFWRGRFIEISKILYEIKLCDNKENKKKSNRSN